MMGGWEKRVVQHWVILALLLGLVMGVYANSLGNGFHYNDFQTISENLSIRSFLTSMRSLTSGTITADPDSVGYRPMLLFSYALNYWISGASPWSYQLLQIIIHAGSVLLVYWVVRRLQKHNSMAILAAVLFGLHPANTEAVNHLMARSSLLSGFFFLLAFSGFLYFRSEEGEARNKRILAYIGSVLAFTMAILTKETALIMPLLLVVYDFYFLSVGQGRSYLQRIIVYTPFMLIAGLYLAMWPSLGQTMALAATVNSDTILNLLTALKVFARYLILFIWPMNLNVDHPLSRSVSVLEGETLLSSIIMGCLVMGIWLLYRRAHWLSFCGSWFLITLLPIGVIPFIGDTSLFQENLGYLASVSFAMAMSWGLFTLAARANLIWLKNGVVIALCTWYALSVVYRNSEWKDEVTLWSDALNKNPGSMTAHRNLGLYYYRQKQWDLAVQANLAVLKLVPDDPQALSNLGMIYYNMKRFDQAEESFRKALKSHPGDPNAHNAFGLFLNEVGNFDEAINEYKEAIRLSPTDWRPMLNLGWTYAGQNHWDSALDSFKMALQVNTLSSDVYISLGTAFKALGQMETAQQAFEQALSLDPTQVSVYEQLSELYIHQGKIPEAMNLMERLLNLNPQNAQAHHAMGYLSEQQAEYNAALEHYKEAIRLEPTRYGSYFNLGNVYWRFGEQDIALKAYEKTLELEPNFLNARFNMGKILENLGRRQEAMDQYRIIMDRAISLGNQVVEMNARQSLDRLASEPKAETDQTKITPTVDPLTRPTASGREPHSGFRPTGP